MTDIRRTVLWVVFTMSLLLLWDGWQRHNGHPSMFAPGKTSSAPATAAAPASGAAPNALPMPVAGAASGAAVSAAAPAVLKGEIVVVKTDLGRFSFDTLGGSLVQAELLKHADDSAEGAPMKVLEIERHYAAQSGVIGVAGAPAHNSAVMTLVSPERELKDGANQLNLRFESPEMGGVKLVKTYTFERGSYAVKVRHEVHNLGQAAISPQLYLQLQRDGSKIGSGSKYVGTSTFTGPAVYNEALKFHKVETDELAKLGVNVSVLDKEPKREAQDGWVAMVQHFFVGAWLHNAEGKREMYARRIGTDLYTVGMVMPLAQVAPGASVVADDLLFIGPQEEKNLAELAKGFDLVKDYGSLHLLAKPLFWLLDQIHNLIGNWGWAIVLLVVLLKIAFYGLNASAYKSMAKMKKVNPRIMELRERLKDKPQEMQAEMMRIYKEEKVNPLGSCLPMLLQIPFFIALYWVLLASVEMRHAPWLGWIVDLSAKDPWFVLPVLMTLSSLLQVWLQPAPPDPMQAKMMWIMPLAFSFMFFFFPAGLVLYWLTNNLLSIAQQWLINKQMGVTN